MKVKLKIGRNIFEVSERDVVVHNGACAILMTQTYFSGWHQCQPSLAKTLFNDLVKRGLLYTTKVLGTLAKQVYKADCMTYYKFNIPAMVKAGYEVVEE